MEATALRESTTRSARILVSINEKESDQVGRYAGWGAGGDDSAPPEPEERAGPAMMPFLRHRAGDRWWRLSAGLLWIPAIIILITVEDWLHVTQTMMWISLGILFAVYLGAVLISDRTRS